MLFSGSLRSNLDPFSHYKETEIWQSLDHAHLRSFTKGLSEGLEYQVGENGEALRYSTKSLISQSVGSHINAPYQHAILVKIFSKKNPICLPY